MCEGEYFFNKEFAKIEAVKKGSDYKAETFFSRPFAGITQIRFFGYDLRFYSKPPLERTNSSTEIIMPILADERCYPLIISPPFG